MSGIDELAKAAAQARRERPRVPLALVTLFAVDGSSYRQPGARLLVDAEARVLAGAISGGCLEGDVAVHAEAVCASGVPRLLTYDLSDDLQTIWGFGTMCDGVAHLFVEPLGDGAWLKDVHRMRRARVPGMLVTILDESALGGTRLLASCTDAVRASTHALVEAATATAFPVHGSISLDEHSVRCLADPVIPPVSLVLIGAGRGAESFASIAHTLGWHVTLIDHRPFVLQSLSLPDEVVRIGARAGDGIAHLSRDERVAVALLTHQFEIDSEWLAQLLPLEIGYVGVLGSRDRANKLMTSLRDGGLTITPRMERMLHAPIGLDLGGESPESIALASIAEIEAIMHARPGGSLRERHSPIHTRTPTPHIIP